MNLRDILKICKVSWELTVTLSTYKYEIGNMYAVSYVSYGVGPCEAQRLSQKSWRHDHSESVSLNITEPRKYDKETP